VVKIPSFLGLCKETTLKCGPSRLHRLDSTNSLKVCSEIIFCKETKSGAEDTENQLCDARIQFMLCFIPLQ